jgi:hypothetical protein
VAAAQDSVPHWLVVVVVASLIYHQCFDLAVRVQAELWDFVLAEVEAAGVVAVLDLVAGLEALAVLDLVAGLEALAVLAVGLKVLAVLAVGLEVVFADLEAASAGWAVAFAAGLAVAVFGLVEEVFAGWVEEVFVGLEVVFAGKMAASVVVGVVHLGKVSVGFVDLVLADLVTVHLGLLGLVLAGLVAVLALELQLHLRLEPVHLKTDRAKSEVCHSVAAKHLVALGPQLRC